MANEKNRKKSWTMMLYNMEIKKKRRENIGFKGIMRNLQEENTWKLTEK